MGDTDDQPPAGSTASRPPRPLRVVVRSGPDRGKTLDLVSGTYHVGKAPESSLVMTDGKVSRQHLELEVGADGVRIRDVGSRNGSWHEGARFERIAVGVGAVVQIGQSELLLVYADGRDPTAPDARDHFGGLWGRAPAMHELYAALARVAAADTPVLVLGEDGSGKQRCAEAIHAASARAHAPFVALDCAATATAALERELFGQAPGHEGAFAAAEGGTLFVDEIDALPLELQPRLLRAIEQQQVKPIGAGGYHKVDVRVVAATSCELKAEVQAQRFRHDLYYRLSASTVTLPPLRARKEDLPMLVEQLAPGIELRPDALALLEAHEWRGNLRELEHVLGRAKPHVGPAGTLGPAELGLGAMGDARPARERLIAAWEKRWLEQLLVRARGDVAAAAKRARLDRASLQRLLKRHAIAPPPASPTE